MFETFDHTADVGLRARADDLDGLFAEAARALFSLLVVNPEAIRPLQEMRFQIDGTARDDLLVDWLAELLYTYDTKRVLFRAFETHVCENGLEATARGEPIDLARHELDMEVKAVTYHGLKLEPEPHGWVAEVIVDL